MAQTVTVKDRPQTQHCPACETLAGKLATLRASAQWVADQLGQRGKPSEWGEARDRLRKAIEASK